MSEHLDKTHFGRGNGLANGLGFPMLLELNEKKSIPGGIEGGGPHLLGLGGLSSRPLKVSPR